MKLVNISNSRRTVYLYCRDDKGNLHIDNQVDFFPYFYEPDQQGKFKGVDGTLLKKVFVIFYLPYNYYNAYNIIKI